MSSVLITGGAGYLGSVLVEELLWKGHDVTVLDNFMYGQSSLLGLCQNEQLWIQRGDVCNSVTMDSLAYDVLIPLAAIVGAPACERNERTAIAVNYDAVEEAVERASDKMIIYPNTNSGYGTGDWCTEETPLKPLSLYGHTKQLAEEAVLKAGGVSLRFATLFGASPRMRTDLMVNDFVLRAVMDRSLVLFEPHFRRNFLHVRDAAAVFAHVIEHYATMRGQVYNAGLSSANLTKAQLCEAIRLRVPDFTWSVVENRTDTDKRDYLVCNEKLERTGWSATRDIDYGIRELIRAYQMPVLRGVTTNV